MGKNQGNLAFFFYLLLAVLTVCSAADGKAAKSVKKRSSSTGGACGKVDIVFLLDSSGSIGAENFNKTLEFLRDVIWYLPSNSLGSNGLQIGVDTFAGSFYREIGLDDYSDDWYFRSAIKSITYRGGGTNTGGALNSTRTGSFSSSAGARSDVHKMIVLVTDGVANNNASAIAAAQLARSAGFYILVVGVGSGVDYGELSAIASDPDSKNIFNASSHSSLFFVKLDVADRICEVCLGEVDVIFLVDNSNNLNGNVYNDTLAMIADVVYYSTFGSYDIKFGVDTFADTYQQQIALGKHSSKYSLRQAVLNLGYQNGGETNTALGILGMQTVSFSEAAGNRPRAAKVGVIVTNGDSDDKSAARTAANSAKRAGIQLVAVGVGSPDLTELRFLASDNTYVFTGTSYSTRSGLRSLFSRIGSSC